MEHHVRRAYADSRLGRLLLVARDDALIGCYFPAHRYPPAAESTGDLVELSEDPVLALAAAQLDEYLAGTRRAFSVPIAPRGDAFNEQVWGLLVQIRYGETTSYGALATQLGNPHLAQRVGQAVGRNPISMIVPCHRVLGADGSLTGFAGGLERKRALLDLEDSDRTRSERLF